MFVFFTIVERLAPIRNPIELRKKFEGMQFKNFLCLPRFPDLKACKEEAKRNNSSYYTYYQDPNFELGVTEIVRDKPLICSDLVKITHQIDQLVKRYPHESGRK